MIVIPMAGLSQRFSDAGFTTPKYMLPVGGRTSFAHAVSSFARYFQAQPFLFIARDVQDTRGFLEREIASLGIGRAAVAILDAPTAGQADTVRLGLAGVPGDEPLTIFNIDTFRPDFRYPEAAWMDTADGYLEVMPGTDPGYSFVLPDDRGGGRVARTAEKQPISTLASTGLYWFRRSADYLRAFSDPAARVAGERYVAPMYNSLIARGLDVRFQEVPAEAVVLCGTPAQFHALVDAGYGAA